MVPKTLRQEVGEWHVALPPHEQALPQDALAELFHKRTGKAVSKATLQNALKDIREGKIKRKSDNPLNQVMNGGPPAEYNPWTPEASEARRVGMGNVLAGMDPANGTHPPQPKEELTPGLAKLFDDIAIVRAAAHQVGGALKLVEIATQLARRGMID